jgi:glycine/D-amino acid oxidase-like deaminating enzyme
VTAPWHARPGRIHAPLARDASADVAIAGAGLAGLSAALHLLAAPDRRPLRVMVLDRSSIGSGATGRGGGHVLAGSGAHFSRRSRECGPDRAWTLHELGREGRAGLAALIARERIDCDWRRTGSHLLALSPREAQELADTRDQLAARGVALELSGREGARERSGSRLFAGSLSDPDDAQVDPLALLRGLADLASARGATVCEGTELVSVDEPAAGGVLLSTPRGRIGAHMLLLCTNAWATAFLPGYADRLLAHRVQLLATAPPGLPIPDGVFCANHAHEHWRRLPGGGLVAGGCRETSPKTEQVLSEEVTGRIQGAIERFLATAFPGLARVPVTHRWAGVAAATCDGLPLVGPVPGHASVAVAAGFGEHDAALAFACGAHLARLVLTGRAPDLEPLSPRRFS